MKKIFFLFACVSFSLMSMADTELFDFSQISLDSWGGSGNPVVTMDPEAKTIKAELVGTPGWQWGNQVKITLNNVAASGLNLEKSYKFSFHAEASTADCGGVTLKFFDNNELFYTGDNYLNFSAPSDFASEWIKPEVVETNGTIVFDFGWDPVQTIILSNLSFLEQGETHDVTEVEVKQPARKVIENGQLIIIKNGARYDVTGAQVH